MHKERASSIGLSEKFVFDAEDIAFIKGDGAMFSKQMLADHFGVSVDTIYDAMKRQPEMYEAYEDAKVQQKNMRKEIVSGYQYKGERNVFDVEDIVELERLSAYLSLEQIAAYFGISQATFYAIMKRQPEVASSYQKGRVDKTVLFAQQLQDKALGITNEGDTTCLLFYLKTRARWSEAVPESKVEDQIVETPEEREARLEDIKLFTQWKKERLANT